MLCNINKHYNRSLVRLHTWYCIHHNQPMHKLYTHWRDIFMLRGRGCRFIVLYSRTFWLLWLAKRKSKKNLTDLIWSAFLVKRDKRCIDLPVCCRKWSKWTRHFYIARSKGSSWKKTQRRKYSQLPTWTKRWSDSAAHSVDPAEITKYWSDNKIITYLIKIIRNHSFYYKVQRCNYNR